MTESGQKLRSPELDAGAVERLWSGVEARRRSKMVRRVRISYAVAAAACLVLGLWGTRQLLKPRSGLSGASLVTGASVQRIDLADGTTVELAPLSKLDVCPDTPGDTCFRVSHGKASFTVTPRKSGPFVVRVDDIEVRVVGTAFDVERVATATGTTSSVTVYHGAVDVSLQGRWLRRLGASEHWSQVLEGSSTDGGTSPAAEPSSAPPEPASHEPRAHQESADEATGVRPAASPPDTRPSRVALWDKARAAKRLGDTEAERSAYRTILRYYPEDSLATFELGRAGMDSRATDNAASLLERAAASSENPLIRESAQARLVELHDQRGNLAACRASQARYLASYPQGSYRRIVEAACSGRSH